MASNLPDYVASAQPVPQENRIPWYKSTAPTFAGIMLWFVFWHEVPMGSAIAEGLPFSSFAGGTLAAGLGVALLGVVLAALICHFLFFLVPGLLGMQTGLPLYIVGTSTYGVKGGFLMPGFLMGALQYGWLSVNAFFAALLLVAPFGVGPGSVAHAIVAILWTIAAAVVGLKGIQYVGMVASYFPVIPITILLILFVSTVGGLGAFDVDTLVSATAEVEAPRTGETLEPANPLGVFGVIAVIFAYIVGFFATAGAAGCDFGMNNRDTRDVQLGGLVGVALATILTGGLSLLIVAGAYGSLSPDQVAGRMQTTGLMSAIMGDTVAAIFWYLLALAAFPPACFASFIGANSFKTTMPNVKPLISCGIGTLVAIGLAVSGLAGRAAEVFVIIGASFGPVCGAMAADYLLAGKKWAGPRAGFNLAGWVSWVIGFIVGAFNFIPGRPFNLPAAPVAAFIVGFGLYWLLAKAGKESEVLAMPQMEGQAAGSPPAEAAPEPPAGQEPEQSSGSEDA